MTSSLVQVPQMTPVKESTNGRDTSAAPPDEATASKQHTPAKRARTSMPDCGSSSGGARADRMCLRSDTAGAAAKKRMVECHGSQEPLLQENDGKH